MKELILHTHRDGYGTDQIERTMTVGDLIDFLQELDVPAGRHADGLGEGGGGSERTCSRKEAQRRTKNGNEKFNRTGDKTPVFFFV